MKRGLMPKIKRSTGDESVKNSKDLTQCVVGTHSYTHMRTHVRSLALSLSSKNLKGSLTAACYANIEI